MSVSHVILRSSPLRTVLIVLTALALLGSLIRLAPPLNKRASLHSGLSSSRTSRVSRQSLYPLLKEISKMDKAETYKALIPPAKVPLRQEDVATVSEMLEQLAEKHGFVVGRVSVSVISESSQRLLSVELPVDGAYGQFGGLMKDILRLPSLEALDRVTVSLKDSPERMRVEFKLALD